MKILLVTTDFIPNVSGIATLSYEQAAGLTNAGHQITVLTTTSRPASIDYPFLWINTEASKWRFLKLVQLFFSLAKTIASIRPDFIWCTNYRGFALPLYILCRIFKIRYGIYLHGTELQTESQSKIRQWVFRKICGQASFRCTNSNNSTGLLQSVYGLQAYPIKPGVNIPAAISSNTRLSLRALWFNKQAAMECFYLLSACRVSHQKGIGLVLQAIANFPLDMRQSIRYVIAGSGPDTQELLQLGNSLGLNDIVTFIGPQDRATLPDIYGACDCYIQPSQPEGSFLESFGISFLEAQACGLPCIATHWGGIPEAVISGETAQLIPPDSVEAVGTAIQFVMENEAWRAQAKTKALHWAEAHSWADHCTALEKLILQAIQAKAS